MSDADSSLNFSTIDPDSDELVQMVDALATASAELDHVTQRLVEQLGRVGSRMRKTLLNEIRLSHQRIETSLTSYLTSAARDKDKLLEELAQSRHSEIRALLVLSHQSRGKLIKEAEEFIAGYSTKIRTDLDAIRTTVGSMRSDAEIEADQQKVSKLSAECAQRVHDLFAAYIRRLPEIPREKLINVDRESSQLGADSEKALRALTERLHAELDAISKASTTELSRRAAIQQSKFSEFHSRLDELDRHISERFVENWNKDEVDNYFTELTDSFQDSLTAVCELEAGSFKAKLENVAHQSRADIVGSSVNCKEEMKAMQSEFMASLAEQQRTAWTQCDALLEKLEKAIESHVEGNEGAIPERVRLALKNMSQEFRGRTAQKSHQMEMYFERTAEGIVENIERLRDEACEQLENEFTQARREFGALHEELERELAELQKQTTKVERAGLGVSSLISAIKKSQISFQQENRE